MAGRGKKKVSNHNKNKIWYVAGYARRSFDDGEYQESYTITNQKKLIQSELPSYENVVFVDYYVDDGYTGTNFKRPGFKDMFEDIVEGRVNAIIVKDLSRLGRNYKELGKYLEKIFPKYGLRIIAINDSVDSFKNPESLDNFGITVKNFMNENYSKEVSKKVSSSYTTMAKEGKFVSGTSPYGYTFDEKDKHHLVIDKEEAKIVKLIFKMTLEGEGRIKICKYLNNKGILCRKELQRRNKEGLSLDPFAVTSKYFWGTTTIGRMLHNVVYIGNLEQMKTKSKSYKDKTVIYKPKEEWIKASDTHDPIINETDFYAVQKIIKDNLKNGEQKSERSYSIYNGIIKCADCGKAMTKQVDDRKKVTYSNFYCSNYLKVSNMCSPHKIKTDDLNLAVMEAVKLQIKLVIELERSLSKLGKNSKEKIEEKYRNDMKILETKLEFCKSSKKTAYEDWKFNKISKIDFIEYLKELDEKVELINNEISVLQTTYYQDIKRVRKSNAWIEHFKRNKNIKMLKKETIQELIKRIYVTKKGDIKIEFKYKDEYTRLLNYVQSGGEEVWLNGELEVI